MNVLLSSVGRRSYLVNYFRSAVGSHGKVIATNSIADTSGMLAADVSCVLPSAAEPCYVDSLLDVCEKHNVKLLFSLHDWEAPFIAAAADRFKNAGVLLGISNTSVLKTCLEKQATYAFCIRNGINTPLSYTTEHEALNAYDQGRLAYPMIVKANCGQGSLALHVSYSADELKAACVLAKAQVDRFSDNGVSKASKSGIVIQEYLAGVEYGLDVINDFCGNFLACLVKRKISMRSGETDSATTVNDPMLTSLGKRISESLRHVAMLDADVIVKEGVPYLIEMNPRFGGHYPFSHIAGANVPAVLVALAEGRKPNFELLQVQEQITALKDLVINRLC